MIYTMAGSLGLLLAIQLIGVIAGTFDMLILFERMGSVEGTLMGFPVRTDAASPMHGLGSCG